MEWSCPSAMSTYILIHMSVGHTPSPCMCHGHSCLFADPSLMQSRIAQKYSALGLNHVGLEMSPSP